MTRPLLFRVTICTAIRGRSQGTVGIHESAFTKSAKIQYTKCYMQTAICKIIYLNCYICKLLYRRQYHEVT